MFKNVVVGVDGRAGGFDAIALASRLADADAKLTLVHVYTGGLNPTHAITPGLVNEEREASERVLRAAHAAASANTETASVVALDAGRGLHVRADEQKADLIVVGSCSRGRAGRVMLGDDARAALNGAPCAVAVAAHDFANSSASLARLGVAYNGSEESKAALAVALTLAAPTRAAVRALEVVGVPTYGYTGLIPVALSEGIDAMLDEAKARMAALPVSVDGDAVYGLVGEELAAFSAQVDLLVVGSRSYGPLRRLVLGSTTNYLERHARSSLLVLPRGVAVPETEMPRAAGPQTATLA
jgi:nucleotide-binding universal stress UspA family protein